MQNCLVIDSLTTTCSTSRLQVIDLFSIQKEMYLELSCFLDNTGRCCLGKQSLIETTDRVDCTIRLVCGIYCVLMLLWSVYTCTSIVPTRKSSDAPIVSSPDPPSTLHEERGVWWWGLGSCCLVPRPHPLTRRNGLGNQVEFIGLVGALATV